MKASHVLPLSWALTAVAACAAAVLLWLAQGNDPARYRASIDTVQDIQKLAAEWSIETARVRTDPFADFDALAAFVPRMAELKAALLAGVKAIPDVPGRLANDVSAYVNAVEAREERIERFKTGYAVVRNSSRYLPLAASDIVHLPGVDPELSREVSALTNDINGYLASPSDAAKGRLRVAVERLGGRADGEEPALRDRIVGFVAHAEVLLARQAPTDDLFAQATSSEISDLAAEVSTDLGAELARKEARRGAYMNGVLGVGAGLIVLWAVAAAVRVRGTRSRTGGVGAGPLRRTRAAQAGDEDAPASRELIAHRILARTVSARIAAEAAQARAELDGPGARSTPRRGPDANGGEVAAPRGIRVRLDTVAALADGLARASAQQGGTTHALVDVNDCVRDVAAAADAGGLAAVTVDAGPVPEVFASESEIRLLLETVVENALQGLADSGKDEGEIKVSTATVAGAASITVIDNGPGMTPEARERMFEPFFAADAGRVGLVAVAHLVDKYGGSVSVSSIPDGGTVMRIRLPGVAEV